MRLIHHDATIIGQSRLVRQNPGAPELRFGVGDDQIMRLSRTAF